MLAFRSRGSASQERRSQGPRASARIERCVPVHQGVHAMKLERRALLRGLGGLGIATPWLEATQREAEAQTTPGPKRFVLFFDHGGTISAAQRNGKKPN